MWRVCLFSFFVILNISAEAQQSASPASTRLAKIADEYWQHELQTAPYYRLQRGDPINDLPDISPERAKHQAAFARHILKELAGIKESGLNHDDWLTLEILRWRMTGETEWPKYYWLIFQISPSMGEIATIQQIVAGHQFHGQADLDHYLSLLRKCPAFFNQVHTLLKEQVRRGIVFPKDGLQLVTEFISAFLQAPESSPFFVGEKRLKDVDSSLVGPFQQQVKEVISAEINPAVRSLLDYVKGEYSQKAPETVGLAQYQKGKEYYRFLVRYMTTLDITPEEVHQIGLKAVERSEARMAELRRSIGFTGTQQEFHQFLRTDPRFFAKTPEEFEARLRFYIYRIEPLLPKYFSLLPKAPYGLRPLPSRLEQAQSMGHYQNPTAAEPMGIYYYNASTVSTTSLLFAGHLMLHELIPGHHFQMALQAENTHLPEFRRTPAEVAFTEGWGDYSAYLGQEMGVFENAYDLYGMYATDVRKSIRLVVDTGMNYMGWSRSKAIEYTREHSMDSDSFIDSETLEEGVEFPGYWLAYKIGSTEFIELREKAKQALGNKFDIRQFHACVLENGSMPLDVLKKQVEWCVGRSK